MATEFSSTGLWNLNPRNLTKHQTGMAIKTTAGQYEEGKSSRQVIYGNSDEDFEFRDDSTQQSETGWSQAVRYSLRILYCLWKDMYILLS